MALVRADQFPNYRVPDGIPEGAPDPPPSATLPITLTLSDMWGDVVNVTNRLEGTAEPMKIHVSESVHARLEDSYIF